MGQDGTTQYKYLTSMCNNLQDRQDNNLGSNNNSREVVKTEIPKAIYNG